MSCLSHGEEVRTISVVVYCDDCRRKREWPKPSVRVTTDPCEICGGHDAYRTRKVVNGEEIIRTVKLKNFEHDARFLVGTREETKLQDPIG